MKKVVILAAAALTLAACAKTYELQETAQPKIGFGTWAETLTKATVGGTFDKDDTFNVWGYKTVSGTDYDVFNGVTVTKKTNDDNSWAYDNLKYWDLSATSYTFFAVSPAATGYTLNTENGAITASPSIAFSGKNSDILVADQTVVAKGDDHYFNDFGRVNLSFNHVAALLDVNVKASAGLVAENAIVKVKSIQIQNIDSEGTFTVAGGYTSAPAATWDPKDDTYATYNKTNCTDEENCYELNAAIGNASRTFINKLIVMPQVFRSTGAKMQEVLITYSIQYENGAATDFAPAAFSLALFDIVDDQDNEDTHVSGWAPGTHYIYTITIDANAINFTASIENWKNTENAYYYLVK